MNRLAVDPGPAATGFAVERGSEIVLFGTRRFRDLERGRHSDWESECAELYAQWLTYTVRKHLILEVMVEDAFLGRRSPDVRWVCWAHISTALLCKREGVRYRPFGSSTMKRFATGKGNAKPKEMIAAAQRRGYAVQTDHEADAVMALLMSQDGAMPGPLGRVA